jgi:hypothetical protein
MFIGSALHCAFRTANLQWYVWDAKKTRTHMEKNHRYDRIICRYSDGPFVCAT